MVNVGIQIPYMDGMGQIGEIDAKNDHPEYLEIQKLTFAGLKR